MKSPSAYATTLLSIAVLSLAGCSGHNDSDQNAQPGASAPAAPASAGQRSGAHCTAAARADFAVQLGAAAGIAFGTDDAGTGHHGCALSSAPCDGIHRASAFLT